MFEIKFRIKSALILFVVTIIVYLTYDNLQKIEAERNLPVGVTEIEISDWMKTREADEIGDGEKKLNSHIDLKELNQNISTEDVQAIDGLYDAKWNLRSISLIPNQESTEENAEDTVDITGNKVLRTIVKPDKNYDLRYHIDQFYEYLKSDRPIQWSENGTTTWNLWTRVDDTKTSIEWRMLSGKFYISDEQIKKLKSKDAQAVLGIPADNNYGFELIIPYNDIISIFVNKGITTINYTNRSMLKTYNLNDTLVSYKYTSGSKDCKNEYHDSLSNHTDGHHVDTNTLNESNLLDSNIADKLKLGDNTIDILIGNFIVSEDILNSSCGFSKLNLYIIESPKINISAQFYTYKNEEIVYFDQDYLPKKDEKVYLRIDVENNSETIALNNLDLSMNINSQLPLKINGDSVFYNNQDITSKIRCYVNEDFSKQYTVEELKDLTPSEKITIMSEDISYTITQKNCVNKYVYIDCIAKLNYVRGDLTYVESKTLQNDSGMAKDRRLNIPVSTEFGCLNISCLLEESNQEDENEATSFMLNISGGKDFANLLIKSGQTYKLNDLCLSQYDINLIVPQDYQVVDTDTYSSSIQNTVSLNSTNYEKNIQIKLKKKNNPYFYKNDQEKVTVSFN